MQTQYPLVLVHGLSMKDVLFLRSFGGIERMLRAQGRQVLISRVDAFGSIETNAAQLKEEINQYLMETGAEKVNIIAHSKGGLDARYMIGGLEMAEKVASLTTLCTPHKGSPVATWVLKVPNVLLKPAAFAVDVFYRLLGDKHPDSLKACIQLQRVEQGEEEALPPVDERVYCQSFSAVVKEGEKRADFVMAIPAVISRTLEKGRETDGLVPRDSAAFGHYRGNAMEESLSHAEIVDFMVLSKGKKERIYAFYAALCDELAQMGY